MAKEIKMNQSDDNNQQQPQIDISKSKPMKCAECGYDVFITGTKFRRISKLITNTPQDMIIPLETLLCGNCGAVNQELLPDQIKAVEENDAKKEQK